MIHNYYLVGCLIAGVLFLAAMLAKTKSKNFRVLMLILGDVILISSELYHRSEFYETQHLKDFGSPVPNNSFITLIALLILVNVGAKKLIYDKKKES